MFKCYKLYYLPTLRYGRDLDLDIVEVTIYSPLIILTILFRGWIRRDYGYGGTFYFNAKGSDLIAKSGKLIYFDDNDRLERYMLIKQLSKFLS